MPTRSNGSDTSSGTFGVQISRESLSQQAYVAIRTSLKRSVLKPGQKLVARQVADELGISVTPVRESLLRLASERALAMDDRGTVFVPELTVQRCTDIRDLRMLVEGEAAARAALRVSDEDIAELERIHARYESTESAQDYSQALMHNEDFHFALCRFADSPVMFGVVENLWIQFGPALSFLYDGGTRPFHGTTHGHLQVIEALRDKDAEAARSAISRDILIGGSAIVERLEELESPAGQGAQAGGTSV
ncbi:GntR family transcriptional regulator [Salipiger abyssi]|uniref:GntR family transcriptional regulator n=1 Tax=Salipiger abyssi TaxID=1250539 RepID=UPI001A8CDF63|nr:GntR family transcriptional regulator [Salipiger abyssi]MBN9887152.1 GntR family transcriptional regulator [Salipiger abyssi]